MGLTTDFEKKMLLHILLIIATLGRAKLYHVIPADDLAFVERQLFELTRDYRNGLPRNGADSVVCIPVTGNDSRQRAYAHVRHILNHHHHTGIRVTYESYREYLQRGSPEGTTYYNNRFCFDVSDLDHIKRILEKGELAQ